MTLSVAVTGATGLVGSHIVARLATAGHDVTVLVRPGHAAGACGDGVSQVIRGDLADRTALEQAFRGRTCVVHAAGCVGDAVSEETARAIVVGGTANVVQAAVATGVRRVVYISSLAVLDTRATSVAEDTPFAASVPAWNHYVRAKQEAEGLLWIAGRTSGVGVTVLRPSVVLGECDRHTTPRILRLLRSPWATLIDRGVPLVPCIVVTDLANAALVAVADGHLAGRSYNLSGREPISQRALLALHAEPAGLPVPTRSLSRRLAHVCATTLEEVYRLRKVWPPPLSRFLVWVATAGCRVDTTRAAIELGWTGRASYAAAIRRAIAAAPAARPARREHASTGR